MTTSTFDTTSDGLTPEQQAAEAQALAQGEKRIALQKLKTKLASLNKQTQRMMASVLSMASSNLKRIF